jgi:hypothetical protein
VNIFSTGGSHYIPSNSHIGKIHVEPAKNRLVTMAYKQRIEICRVIDLHVTHVGQRAYSRIKEKFRIA